MTGFLIIQAPDTSWQEHAACKDVDPDIFFPEGNASIVPAQMICRKCSVQPDCLDYAMAINEYKGVWGGMSERQRRKIRRNRRG